MSYRIEREAWSTFRSQTRTRIVTVGFWSSNFDCWYSGQAAGDAALVVFVGADASQRNLSGNAFFGMIILVLIVVVVQIGANTKINVKKCTFCFQNCTPACKQRLFNDY